MQETWVRSLCQEDPLEEEMATHSSILAWRIPWKRSLVGSLRVGHDFMTKQQQSVLSHFVEGILKWSHQTPAGSK